jgi:hypothetical protein
MTAAKPKSKRPNATEVHWLPERFIRDRLGLQAPAMIARNVAIRRENGRDEFSTADIFDHCADLLFDHLKAAHPSLADMDELKADKIRQEIWKLELQNRKDSGQLVEAADVEMVYGRGIRAMADELDSVIGRVKMKRPDIDQATLAVIADCLAEARRKAARITFGQPNGDGI